MRDTCRCRRQKKEEEKPSIDDALIHPSHSLILLIQIYQGQLPAAVENHETNQGITKEVQLNCD